MACLNQLLQKTIKVLLVFFLSIFKALLFLSGGIRFVEAVWGGGDDSRR
jgi:hypothetical protein